MTNGPHAPQIVTVREVTDADLPILYEQQLDPEATRMAAFASRAREPFMAHWARIRINPAEVVRTIVCDGAVAGNIVSWGPGDKREIGYWLGREYWGRGIATQALAAFLNVVRERPLWAHVAGHNIGSRRVLEKCGFVFVRREMGPPAEPGGEDVPEIILRLK